MRWPPGAPVLAVGGGGEGSEVDADADFGCVTTAVPGADLHPRTKQSHAVWYRTRVSSGNLSPDTCTWQTIRFGGGLNLTSGLGMHWTTARD